MKKDIFVGLVILIWSPVYLQPACDFSPQVPRRGLAPNGFSEPEFLNYKVPKNSFQGINSARPGSLACRYDNPIPTRLLVPIDCFKIPALQSYRRGPALPVGLILGSRTLNSAAKMPSLRYKCLHASCSIVYGTVFSQACRKSIDRLCQFHKFLLKMLKIFLKDYFN